jgi:hypothetical protein
LRKAIGVGCRVGRNGLVGCWTERRRSPAWVLSWEPVRDVSRFLKSAIQMNFAENQSWPARRLGRAAGWESPGGPVRETAPGGAQGELQGRQSQVGRGGSVLVLLLLAFDVCIHLVVWSVVRAGQAESHPDTHRSCADAFCRRSRDRSRAFISS